MNIDPAVNDNLKEQAAHGSHEFPLQVYQDMEYCENGLILTTTGMRRQKSSL